jgi:uncharacterized protein
VLAVRESEGRGRGVFATEDIAEGTLLEECHVVVVPAEQVAPLIGTILRDYVFAWGGTDDEVAVALGFGSLYNHARDPNAMFVRKHEARALAFFAVRPIAAGEEITVSYHGGYGDRGDVWFETR